MVKLLAIMPLLPYPPYQGTNIRNFNLIKHLAKNYRIHLLCFYENPDQLVEAKPLWELCELVEAIPAPAHPFTRRLALLFLSRLPDMAFRKFSPLFQKRLENLLHEHQYELVHVEGIEMARYGLWMAAQKRPRPGLVFGDQNAEYLLQKRAFETDIRQPRYWPAAFYSLIQWKKLARYEAQVCRTFDRVVAVSEADKEALRKLVPGLRVAVVPNGVDVDYYAQFVPGKPPLEGWSPYALVFTGRMDFRPNVDAALWFAEEILPRIRARFPQAHFYVVGQSPHPRLSTLYGRSDVTVTGFVEDVRPYIASAAVYVVPIRIGGGTRLKVLEAMAMRKAVVSTSLGCEGFPVMDKTHLVVADTPDSFAEAVCELLADEGKRTQLGEEAFRFVDANYRWEHIVPRLEEVYRELLQR